MDRLRNVLIRPIRDSQTPICDRKCLIIGSIVMLNDDLKCDVKQGSVSRSMLGNIVELGEGLLHKRPRFVLVLGKSGGG